MMICEIKLVKNSRWFLDDSDLRLDNSAPALKMKTAQEDQFIDQLWSLYLKFGYCSHHDLGRSENFSLIRKIA